MVYTNNVNNSNLHVDPVTVAVVLHNNGNVGSLDCKDANTLVFTSADPQNLLEVPFNQISKVKLGGPAVLNIYRPGQPRLAIWFYDYFAAVNNRNSYDKAAAANAQTAWVNTFRQ